MLVTIYSLILAILINSEFYLLIMPKSPTTFASPSDPVGFASKAALIGVFLGAGVVLRTDGSAIAYAGGVTLTGVVAVGIYFALMRLAAGVEGAGGREKSGASPRHGRPVAADGRGDKR